MSSEQDVRPFALGTLRDAFTSGQFLLVYQPIFDLHTSAFVGVEALIRWRHPRLGLLGPDDFIETLESSDLVGPVGRWTLETACDQGAIWHDAGYRFRVSVNVSSRQWGAADLVEDVHDVLDASRFDAGLLVLEVSRSTVHADPDAVGRLGALASMGVHRAVDDFLPDEDELEYLSKVGVDVVKIDRSYVAGRGDAEAEAIVALARRAESLGIQVIAAGIEDASQRDRFAREQIASGQGFGLSEPYEADEIDRYLEDFSIFSGKPLG
ncbi:MAG: EAL domain-containing protein [Acidimicrobiales bacterium]